MEDIRLSVCVVTYNHKDYIRQCLDGILMQKTTFPFEIILGEDESMDGTREICKAYAEKFPEKIRLFLRSREDVIYINGNPTGRYNFIESLKAAKGKYIALCEGDDYWTDPFKLQKQVDFLEENKECVLCFHRVKLLVGNELQDDFITEERFHDIKERPISQKALFEHSNFIHTPSVVFRNVTKELPIEFKFSPVGDLLLYYYLTKFGFIHRLEDTMAVYRYGQGIYSKLSKEKKTIIGKQFSVCLLSFTESDEIKEVLLKSILKDIKQYESNNMDHMKKSNLFKDLLKRIKLKLKKNLFNE